MSPADKVAARIKADATCKVLSKHFAERSTIGLDGRDTVHETFTENDNFNATVTTVIAGLMSEGLKNASSIDSVDKNELGHIFAKLMFDYAASGEHVQRLIAEEIARIEEDEAEARRDDDQVAVMEKAA